LNGLVFDIRRYSIHDGPGIRTTVFFKGCPLRCVWCHNPESQEGRVDQIAVQKVLDGMCFEKKLAVGSWQSAGEVMEELEKDAVFFEESGGGVTFSGGEPLMQPDALRKLLELCRERNYHTAIDTCGYADPVAMNSLINLAHLWLFDLKLIDESKHLQYTGVSNKLILKNLETLAIARKEVIIRFPVIPGITDGDDNLEAVANLILKLGLKKIDLLAYHTIAKDKYRRLGKDYGLSSVEKPTEIKMDGIMNFFRKKGFIVNVGG
jgi:pyruvate formate lyase activating enzyme